MTELERKQELFDRAPIRTAVCKQIIPANFDPNKLRKGFHDSGKILAIGFPSAMQYALTVVAVAAQANFVSKYETAAVARLGIVKKLDQLPLYFSIGVANGLLPLLAYNYASGDHARQKNAFRFGCMVSLGFLCYAS